MQITATTKDAYKLLHYGALALQKASQNGMHIDVDYCVKKIKELDIKISKHEQRFWKTKVGKLWRANCKYKCNINSDLQIQKIFFDILNVEPVKYTDTGKASVDNEVLVALAEKRFPAVRHILKIRKYSKASDYLKGLYREQVNGVLHPFFPLHLVKTFRSSSQSINFHNQPKRDKEIKKLVRSAIYPRKRHRLGSGDFSGIEVHISCVYTQDEKLIYDVIHGDMHKDMAQELYMLDSLDKHDPGENNFRQGGKNGFVFPQFYGDYYGNCAPSLLNWAKLSKLKNGTPGLVHLQDKGLIKLDKQGQIKNYDKFIEHVRKVEDQFWNVRYKKYQAWRKKQWNFYEKKGYVNLLTGFRCAGVMNPKQVVNYPIQGTAFHCLLWSFIQLTDRLEQEKWDTYLIGQIHDEMVTDMLPEETRNCFLLMQQITCVELPETWKWINVPLEIDFEASDTDHPWYEMQDYEVI